MQLMTTFMRVIIEGTRDRRRDTKDARRRRSIEISAIFSGNTEYSAIGEGAVKFPDSFDLEWTVNERRVKEHSRVFGDCSK